MTSLLFGDAFRYNGKDYIFLAKTEEIIYAAQILSVDQGKKIDELFQKKLVNGQMTEVVASNLLYCYVILRTEELKDRMAHFASTGKDGISLLVDKLPISLDKNDLKAIKDEIMRKNPIPIELKQLISPIKV